jgi:Skp family chaperone for outer membrane proteins
MCGRKKPNSMIDKKLRGSNDLEVIIYELKKEIDRLNEELQAKEIELQKIKDKLDHKPDNYDELGY